MKFRACSTFSDRHSTLLECQNHFELVQDPVYGNFSLGVAHLIAENYQQAEKFLSFSKNSIPGLVLYKNACGPTNSVVYPTLKIDDFVDQKFHNKIRPKSDASEK